MRRVIVVSIEGLELASVDLYLEQGLLHNLALLSDIGTRANWFNPGPFELDDFAAVMNQCGLPAVALPSLQDSTPKDLNAICAADRDQQDRLIAALGRSHPAVVACVFDMPARVRRLFGSRPDAHQRTVIRDVYARMDEIVGKAFSFVDERTALLAAISNRVAPIGASTPADSGVLFTSCLYDGAGPILSTVPSVVMALAGVAPHRN